MCHAAYALGQRPIPRECTPPGSDACSCGGTWEPESTRCTVFTQGIITSTTICDQRCSSCAAFCKVDGGEHLLLLKGTWTSPTFYSNGACQVLLVVHLHFHGLLHSCVMTLPWAWRVSCGRFATDTKHLWLIGTIATEVRCAVKP